MNKTIKYKIEISGSVKSYFFGFLFSLVLTLAAYILVVIHHNSGHVLVPHEVIIPAVLLFAVLQAIIQIVFFLHLGFEKGSSWNLIFLTSTVFIIFMVVVGSIWIMYHLNYNMTPHQVENFILQDEAFHN